MNGMIQKSKKNLKSKKGFTLIELIVVIVILGILAAIAIPRLAGFTDTAQASAAEADARTIITAASALFTEKGAGTYDKTDIEVLTGTLKGAFSTDKVEVDDKGNVDFEYTLDGNTVIVDDSVIQ